MVETFDPNSKLCMDHLWEEIQNRYGFQAPNPMDFHDFLPPRGRFFLAEHPATGEVMGSAAYTRFNDMQCELDSVYVIPKFRKNHVAKSLLNEIEKQARIDLYSSMILRAGAPQPEALTLYKNFGFKEIPTFGKWVTDPTAICFEKKII
ncbi:GNAT family N-acetyltransferase [Leptospira montravelensis]|uniref:GNAT family N-acetyltransferase n=2 Tax=Leptospiraceae TaxID=170 RepID=A0ABY2LS09_9LEPT|nr:GNAT family N-acetyltransferase [Leptospira montravelensis]TGK81284.1 GNAT family N-acetyltransferase [Leptospira montravelensis]TGL01327.1 GNAT family N-acetyltransferase [Leptospira montravelensis]